MAWIHLVPAGRLGIGRAIVAGTADVKLTSSV